MKRFSSCLSDLGIDDASPFAECDGADEEFKVVKKIYFDKILREHPDKGGDAATFRATRAAFQVLRDLYEKGSIRNSTFASYLVSANAKDSDESENDDDENYDDDDDDDEDFFDEDLADLYERYSKNTSAPSYEFYAAAAEEEVPGYKVELAKSGRSACTKCQSKIDKGGIRVGSLDKVSGTYGRWAHLNCWRVPVKVQNGLTNPSDERASLGDLLSMEEVLLTGAGALDDASKLLFVQHCINGDHWAGNRKRKRAHIMGETDSGGAAERAGASEAGKARVRPSAAASSDDGASAARSGSDDVVAGSFAVLVPGVDGAVDDDKFLRGKTFVVSGMFPEVGGGDADAPGVANVKAMIHSFGGKVITRFSKNSNFLLVGKDAIASKFKDAKKRSVDVISLRRLQALLLGRVSFQALKDLPALTSDEFMASAYQAAGGPLPPRGREMSQPRDSSSPAAKMPAATSAKAPAATMPSKPKTNGKDSKPAAAKAAPSGNVATAASASSRAMVVSAQPNKENNSASAIVPHSGKKAKFSVPRPGVNGAVAGVLGGKRFVLTGVFPELGGGTGLSLGKDRTKSMIESFGGKVTSAVSGKTDFVLVGKDPGRSKVSQADGRGIPLIDLLSLQRLLLGQTSLEGAASEPPPRITNFSAGYPGQKRIAY